MDLSTFTPLSKPLKRDPELPSNMNPPHSSPLLLKRKSLGKARPNTSLLYTPSSSNLLPFSPANVLHPHGIAKLLTQYPNRRFVDTITTIAASGVRVGFKGTPFRQTHRPNHGVSTNAVYFRNTCLQDTDQSTSISESCLPFSMPSFFGMNHGPMAEVASPPTAV